MKSQHRHELETNWLAQNLGVYIERLRPYTPTIFGAIVAALVLMIGISYFTSASTARESDAWNTYNDAVSGMIPNLNMLRLSAEEYPDSAMQQWADVTWADGQVWMAGQSYMQSRPSAMDALYRAEGMYTSLLAETEDKRLAGRAHFGLGRIYEFRNELDRAREEYLAVEGDFEELARQRADELAKPSVKQACEWLVTAEPPRRTAPLGPGTPGQRPEFSAGDLDMPAAGTKAETAIESVTDDLFKGLGVPTLPAQPDRYGTGDEKTGTDVTSPATDLLAPEQPAGEAAPEP